MTSTTPTKADRHAPAWRRPAIPRPADILLKIIWVYALIAFPRIKASTPAEVAFFYFTFFTLILGPPGYWLYHLRDQRRREARFAEALAHDEIPPDEKIFLYLRSFKGSLFYIWRARTFGAIRLAIRMLLTEFRILSPAVSVPLLDRDTENPERRLQKACVGRGTVVGIGDRYKTRGAIKVYPSDEDWQAVFTSLADRATTIYCQLDHTSASLWEIEKLFNEPQYASKTFLLLPPEADAVRFQKTRDACKARDISLPPYASQGWIHYLSRRERTLRYDALDDLAASESAPLQAFENEMDRQRFDLIFSRPRSLVRTVLSLLAQLAVVAVAMVALSMYLNSLR